MDDNLFVLINSVLDEIRPMVEMDGGGVIIDKIEGKDVYLEIQGACVGCPMSSLTYGVVVEKKLREVCGDKIGKIYYNENTEDIVINTK
jgi:NifU-like protein